MAQSPSMPVLATTDAELTQAEAELWSHNFGYLKSMALQCVIKLGIPNAIHRRGGAASLPELHASIPVAASKRPCLSRIMTFLAVSGIFRDSGGSSGGSGGAPAPPTACDLHWSKRWRRRRRVEEEKKLREKRLGRGARGREPPYYPGLHPPLFREENDGAAAQPRYHLTAASRLLLVDDGVDQLLTLCSSPSYFCASQNLAAWLKQEDDGGAAAARTPFAMAHGGAGFYDVVGRDAAFAACFDAAMGSDTGFVSGIIVREHGEVFDGVATVVDVGGHNGTTARAIAGAFPHVRCTVLDLPRVVDAYAVPGDGDATVEFVAGDMREFIPPADAVLFKCVLHNWNDEDCVQILKRAKEAISTREPKGKVVITEVVLASPSNKHTLEAQLLMDLCMMVVLEGKERTEEAWHKIFLDAGFTGYKITPISGTTRSLIEVFP